MSQLQISLIVNKTNWLWKNYCNVQFTFRCEWSSLLWKDSEKQASPFLGPLLPEWTRDWTKKQTKHSDTNTEPYFKWNLCILFWCAKEQIHYVNTKKAFMAFIKYFSRIPANLKLHNRVYILYLLTNLNTPINQWEHMYMKHLSYFVIWNVSPGLWDRHPVEHSWNTHFNWIHTRRAPTVVASLWKGISNWNVKHRPVVLSPHLTPQPLWQLHLSHSLNSHSLARKSKHSGHAPQQLSDNVTCGPWLFYQQVQSRPIGWHIPLLQKDKNSFR